MDASSATRSERSTAARWLPLAVFVFSALLFADSARNGFAMDDWPLVVNNLLDIARTPPAPCPRLSIAGGVT
jgi:hypothetical protein